MTANVLALPKPAGLSDLEPAGEESTPGGPRASMLASPGLNLDILLVSVAGGGETTRFSSMEGELSGFGCVEGDLTGLSASGAVFSCARYKGFCCIEGDKTGFSAGAAGFSCVGLGEATGLSNLSGATRLGFSLSTSGLATSSFFDCSLILFCLLKASGVSAFAFSFSGLGSPAFRLPALPSSSRLAKASGLAGVAGGPLVLRSWTMPASFSCFH